MAINSMTGFARTDGALDSVSWYWEIKSVNGKGLDMRFRLPAGFEALEAAAREIAARHVRRGNLQINLQLTREAGRSVLGVNEETLSQVLALTNDLRERMDAPPVTVEGILSVRGVLEVGEVSDTDEVREARQAAIQESFAAACTELAAMRRTEGLKLSQIVAGQLDAIDALTNAARDCPARTPEAVKARLTDQVARLIDTGAALDPDRLHQEAVLIATKGDIREELDRLFAHVAAARELLQSDEPVGRKFDFVAQEFNREANTLCSKSTDQSLTQIGLDLKTVIDQLREQVQNIE